MCAINMHSSTIGGLKVSLRYNAAGPCGSPSPAVSRPNIISPAIYSHQIKVEITTSAVMEGTSADNGVDRVDILNGWRCLSSKRAAIIHGAAADVLEILINLLCLSTCVRIKTTT